MMQNAIAEGVFERKAKSFTHVVGVVLLQDMKGRFNTGSYFGYLIAIGWPLSHLLILTLGYLLRTEISPIGDSPTVFIATGVMPYILCFYPARTMAIAIAENRQLLNIPFIKPIHLMISRCILEILNAIIVLAIFVLGAYLLGVDVTPEDPTIAFAAVGASIFLGVGFGFLNATLMGIFGPFYMIIFIMIFIGLFLTAGVYMSISVFPENVKEYIYYNPIAIIVDWTRSAYYISLDSERMSKTLVIYVASVFLALGLAGERFMRGKFF
jgi:capsular polysaccharide transport system permease protein